MQNPCIICFRRDVTSNFDASGGIQNIRRDKSRINLEIYILSFVSIAQIHLLSCGKNLATKPYKLRSEKPTLLTRKALKYYKKFHIYLCCVKIKEYFNKNLFVKIAIIHVVQQARSFIIYLSTD